MEINTDIINVLTKDFTFVKRTIENSNIDNITKSLNILSDTFNQYAKSISDMKNEDGLNTLFIPYFNSGQLLQEIKEISEDIIVLSGIDPESDDFKNIRDDAWLRYCKIVIDESHRGMVQCYTSQYIDMFKKAHPRNKMLQPERVSPRKRYDKFVELVNQNFAMKEIAVALGVSIPTVYLIRTHYKDRLLSDPKVVKTAKALKFNRARKNQ
jgi:hypothetical protein